VSSADEDRWDARHTAAEDVGPLPPDALRGQERLLPSGGRALDVACGRGAVACWLAGRGFRVDAVDVSSTGIAAGATLAERLGVAGRVWWWHHDLDDGLPTGCIGPYDVVVCQRFRDVGLYEALVARLAVGGLLVVTVLSEVGERAGAYRAPAGELLAVFGGLDVLAHREGDGEASLVARRPASRP
jgi:SAM-dependent methyltransferase